MGFTNNGPMTDTEREVVESSVALQSARLAYSKRPKGSDSTLWSALHKARARWERAVARVSGVAPWHGVTEQSEPNEGVSS